MIRKLPKVIQTGLKIRLIIFLITTAVDLSRTGENGISRSEMIKTKPNQDFKRDMKTLW